MKTTVEITTTGKHTEDELFEFLQYEFGCGSCDPDNPFISEDSDAEITGVDP